MIKINYRHWIMIGLVLLSLLIIPFKFKYAHLRIIESIIDLKNSAIYYVSQLINKELHGELTINQFTSLPFELPLNLPKTWDGFKISIGTYWKTFFSKANFQNYILWYSNIFYFFSKILIILLPIIMIILIVLKFVKKSVNNNYNKDSKALTKFKKIETTIYLPVKKWIHNFIKFNQGHKYYLLIIFIWGYSFNIIAIIIEFISYYLYLIASFKTSTIYIQLLKLLMDLSTMINFIPPLLWFIIIYIVFHQIRKKIGYDRLNHYEMKDRGFINERPIVLMVCGTMGKKKTTMITDMALSQEIMFRDKAFEKILDCDLMFPFFPWINLENSIKKGIEKHIIYNLATCRKFINNRKKYFQANQKNGNIWDYDYNRYGLEYDNKLNIINVWEVIENYTQLYFVYVIQSSLIISNYSIRTDNQFLDSGNFPLWDNDLFKRDSKYLDAYSRHSHILDYDSLRLGKTLIKDNKYTNSFEFGVINITEIGKERGNNLELQAIKKNDSYCNQKNDLFNNWLKMVRHSATIDNYPFVRVICDEQRPESWGADARDLCEIINIDECSELNLSMPFFFFEDLIIKFILSKFSDRYYKYRYERADNTLIMYLYHGLIAKLNKYYRGLYNTFGYYEMDLKIEKGTQDGLQKKSNYYLMSKKIYSKRFSTDCFSEFFNSKALKSQVGINDLFEFKTEKATFEEMLKENSYFFNDLTKLKDNK